MTEFNTSSDMPVPMQFMIWDDYTGYHISWRWFGWGHIFLLFFCIFWFGFLIAWYASVLGGFPETKDTAINWLLLLFPLIHVGVGFGLLYSTICGFFNKTTITLQPDFLNIKHHPLPWVGQARISVGEINQLFVKKKVIRTKNGTKVNYILYVLDNSGKERKLIKNADEAATRYLEYIIEKKLGIKNVSVMGEYVPNKGN